MHVNNNDKFNQQMAKKQDFNTMFTSNVNEEDLSHLVSQARKYPCPYVSMSCLSCGSKMYLPMTHTGIYQGAPLFTASSQCPSITVTTTLYPSPFLELLARITLTLYYILFIFLTSI